MSPRTQRSNIQKIQTNTKNFSSNRVKKVLDIKSSFNHKSVDLFPNNVPHNLREVEESFIQITKRRRKRRKASGEAGWTKLMTDETDERVRFQAL